MNQNKHVLDSISYPMSTCGHTSRENRRNQGANPDETHPIHQNHRADIDAMKTRLHAIKPRQRRLVETQLPPDEINEPLRPKAGSTIVLKANGTLTFPTLATQGLLTRAIGILSDGRPRDVKTLLQGAYDAGWTSSGKTPAATLNAALHREAARVSGARVKKAGRGSWVIV